MVTSGESVRTATVARAPSVEGVAAGSSARALAEPVKRMAVAARRNVMRIVFIHVGARWPLHVASFLHRTTDRTSPGPGHGASDTVAVSGADSGSTSASVPATTAPASVTVLTQAIVRARDASSGPLGLEQ